MQPITRRRFIELGISLALLAGLTAEPARAAEPKKVLVVTTTTGFRHSSISTAEKVLQKLADQSKAFTIVDFARQPGDDVKKAGPAEFDAAMKKSLEKLSPENLKKYDGVIFANTTGDLPLPDRDAFIEWVKAGHAFVGMHSCSDTFHGFPKFVEMLGGEFKTHAAQVPADIVIRDPNHPATKGLPATWQIAQEEMYQFKSYDPAKVHDLGSMDHHPNNKAEAGLFPVAWCKQFGTGKVFYTSLGHREDIWDDDPNMRNRVNSPEIAKQYQQHILGGIKWALGLEPGDATPGK